MAEDRWDQFVAKLPENYRENPEGFIEDYGKVQQEAQEARQYREWYENTYKPWEQANRSSLTEFERWKQSQGGKPQAGDTAPAKNPTSLDVENVDWDDPDAAKSAFTKVVGKLSDIEARLAGESTTLRQEFAQGRDNVMQLIGLVQQAHQLEQEDLYGHLGYKPRRDVTEVVKFAAQNGITDLNMAAQQRYGEEQKARDIEAAVARERERWEREQANKSVATERGGRGVPRGALFQGERQDRRAARAGRGGLRSSDKDYDGLYAAIQQKNPGIEW